MSQFFLLRSFLILTAGLALICSAGCDPTAESPSLAEEDMESGKVATLAVNGIRMKRQVNAIETAVFFGELTPSRQSQLRFSQSGLLKTLPKSVGEFVDSGEVIAGLDTSKLEQQKLELQETLASARQQPQPDLQRIGQIELQIQMVDTEISKGVITAPYDCMVIKQLAAIDDLVSSEFPVIAIAARTPVDVKASFPLKISERLSVDQALWISFQDQTVQAKIKSKSPLESPVGSKAVTLEVVEDLSDVDWSFGQTVKIRFIVPGVNSGYWVPFSALRRESNGLWSCLVVASPDPASGGEDVSLTASKMVKLIQLEDEWALVDGPISENEFVIVEGLNRIVPGQAVELVDVSEKYTSPGIGVSE